MKLKSVSQVITAVSLRGRWVKLIQAQATADGGLKLLTMKAQQAPSLEEAILAGTLKELVQRLPAAVGDALGLLPTAEVLTRYLTLPSEDLAELKSMALYQLEGTVPYSMQECVTSVKVIGRAGEATRVLVAVAHRPVVERLLRITQQAGLHVTRVVTSSEAISCWHRACWPSGEGLLPEVSLAAEFSPEGEGLDIGILVRGELVYMRQTPYGVGGFEELVSQLQETLQAYSQEQAGPPVRQISLSGARQTVGALPLERLEEALQLPVRWVDPLESSPFREALSVTAQELSPEISFSELLGVVCAPRLLALDLLPIESRLELARTALLHEWRRAGALAAVALAAALAWGAARIGGNWWQIRLTRNESVTLTQRVARVQEMAKTVGAIGASQQDYALQLELLKDATQHLSQGMTLQFLGLEASRNLTLRGVAPDLSAVTEYAMTLRRQPLWATVLLRSARTQAEKQSSAVEFEIVLQAKPRKGS